MISKDIDTYFMGYFNQFFHYGLDKFLKDASSNLAKGFIIPDLPHEQAVVYKDSFLKYNLTLIDFVAPTDNSDRIAQLVKNSQDFIYLVAYTGITGSGASEDLSTVIKDIKSHTDTDVYVGFGVDEHSAKTKAKDVDGVIVGSAFIKILLDDTISDSSKINKIANLTRIIKDKINS
jgi:tryptophan synthase alpha chain